VVRIARSRTRGLFFRLETATTDGPPLTVPTSTVSGTTACEAHVCGVWSAVFAP